jgi:hypothetical protein
MANGLSVLMNLAKQPGSSGQIPQQSPEDYQLDDMIPEESLYELQDEIGARGAQRGGAYAIPSRESLRASGRSGLRRMFGEISAKGEAAAMPHRVAGEYGLEEARIKGRADIEKAGMEVQSAAMLRDLQHQQMLERQDALQQALNMRQDKNIAGQNNRSAARESGLAARQQIAALMKQAADLEKQAQGAWPGWIGGNRDVFAKKAQAARQQAMQLNSSAPIPGDDEEMDVSPEEWAEFQAFRQSRGGR